MVADRLRGQNMLFFGGLLLLLIPRAVSFSDRNDGVVKMDKTGPATSNTLNANEAAHSAQHAAAVANQVAAHSVHMAVHTQAALEHARDALRDARADAQGLSRKQQNLLHEAENELHAATQRAEYGRLEQAKHVNTNEPGDHHSRLGKLEKSLQAWGSNGVGELEALRKQLNACRKKLEMKHANSEAVKEVTDIEEQLQAYKDTNQNLDSLKVEVERLREVIAKMKAPTSDAALHEAASTIKPVKKLDLEVHADMPFGELTPFGREDTAQELTEASIRESNKMVDQLEKAEVAEEKRAVFRALTRLRGAAIASYDGVAGAQTANIDGYNKAQNWRSSHPMNSLATEESDVSKWAFPSPVDAGGNESQSEDANF